MKALILQHELSTPPGSTLNWLQLHNIEYKLHQFFETPNLMPSEDFDILFINGGSMNVDEEHLHPWLVTEKQIVLRAIQHRKKVIGLCLGSQIIAEVLGGKVQRHSHTEYGWQNVELLPSREQLRVFHWHSYASELPPEAELIATNDACKNQAFKYKDHVIAFQFHPESTADWIQECALDHQRPSGPYCQTPEMIQLEIGNQNPLQNWYFKQLDQLIFQR